MKKDSTAIEYSNGPLVSNGKFKVTVPMATPPPDQARLEAVARVEVALKRCEGPRNYTNAIVDGYDLRTILDALDALQPKDA